jgi:hypothetical protein
LAIALPLVIRAQGRNHSYRLFYRAPVSFGETLAKPTGSIVPLDSVLNIGNAGKLEHSGNVFRKGAVWVWFSHDLLSFYDWTGFDGLLMAPEYSNRPVL